MKILVIGGTGHVGSEVVKELQKRKADIRLLVRKEDTATPAGVEKAVGDLLAQPLLHRFFDCRFFLPGRLPEILRPARQQVSQKKPE